MKKAHNNDQKAHTKKHHVCHFCIAFKECDFLVIDPFRVFRLSRDNYCNFMVSNVWILFSSLQLKFAQCHTLVMIIIAKHKKLLNIFCIVYGPRQANLVLIAYASSEGWGEPAHPHSLARTFAARSYKQWVKRNLQIESQIPGPSELLGMRS